MKSHILRYLLLLHFEGMYHKFQMVKSTRPQKEAELHIMHA